jgi:hypothetical protein
MVSSDLRLCSDSSAFQEVIAAARDTEPVTGFTHNFYRYPARFSPQFVKSIIHNYSGPGDLICDVFMGGGTTLVEALASGRDAIGCDISSLAAFVSQVKTRVLDDKELLAIERWVSTAQYDINMQEPSSTSYSYMLSGYYRNLSSRSMWRYRKSIEQALSTAKRLRSPKARAFARCVILRTAQWALDGRRNLPTVTEFRVALAAYANEMLDGAVELREAVEALPAAPEPPICLHRSAVGIEEHFQTSSIRAPKLVLTSPPYPGIHVLYHRWQVDGRKESPAPFWIADKLDGAGSSYYTMGDRKYPELATYFRQLKAAFTSVAAICDDDTTVVQMVGFSEPSWQLPQYLATMEEAGFREIPASLPDQADGRLWRSVPNRKWHADQLGDIHASREVVLFHRRALSPSTGSASPRPC